MTTQEQEVKLLFDKLKSIVKDAHNYAKVEGVNFFVQSFNRQGFIDESLEKWQKRTFEAGGGAILVKSGALKRSIKSRSKGLDIEYYTDSSVPYAALHNEGGEITVTLKMKKYFWAMYYKSTGKVTRKKSGAASGSKRNVTLSAKAAFYKAMAMKKVGERIKIPKRQFLGESATLLRQLETWFFKEIDNRFK